MININNKFKYVSQKQFERLLNEITQKENKYIIIGMIR